MKIEAELLERVRNAIGPDRELDSDLCLALNYLPCIDGAPLNLRRADHSEGWFDYEVMEGGRLVDCTDDAPSLTGSIDAAFALVKRMLPDWVVQTNSGDPTRLNHRQPWAKVAPYDTNDAGWKVGAKDARCATIPLTIIAAFLSALEAQP